MTGLQIIKSLEAASVKQAERITKLTQLRTRLESKLDKQRNEERGVSIPLIFLKSYTRFESVSKVSHDDIPRQPHND